MPHALQRRPTTHLSSDVLLTAATVALAALSVVVALAEQYDAGAVVSFAAVVVGGISMMLSATTTERFETVTATIAAAVVLAVCLANGSGVFT